MKIFQVDAFTSEPFAGNPAAVCVLREPARDDWMQKVAREMNLSETAFLVERPDGYDLRWFTPTVEVDLCGHATLASAHVLWQESLLPKDQAARFHTRSGVLGARRDGSWIELDFPAEAARAGEAAPAGSPAYAEILSALRVADVRSVARNRLDVLVELDSEEAVRSLRPDIAAIEAIDSRGVIVTAVSATPERDFVSRYFAPNAGVPEDPVTGSTHCFLGPWWMERLGKDELIGDQVSIRGGRLRVRPRGERVLLAGQAVMVLRGELYA